MRDPRLWVGIGVLLSTVGILTLVLAFETEHSYVLCSTAVPHVECPMADFEVSFLVGGLLVCAGLAAVLYGIVRVRAAIRKIPPGSLHVTGRF